MVDVLGRHLVIFLFFLCAGFADSGVYAAALPHMRPYSGIGLVVFAAADPHKDQTLPLYREPGLLRVGKLNGSSLTENKWLFGQSDGISPLIVSARKGNWLRVYYDDAGREAWLEPQYKGRFQSWEQFLKSHTGHLLPGLKPQYYKLHQQPGEKLLTATLNPNQVFKVLKLVNAWGMVLTDQAQIGWLRWRDEDGRLLIGRTH
ncbi:MAG: hypothetical protein PHH28_01810 [Desulfuromonadaceae bacterium]|nr:hypothetical protein [Desulfuromonadaceae bacterium]